RRAPAGRPGIRGAWPRAWYTGRARRPARNPGWPLPRRSCRPLPEACLQVALPGRGPHDLAAARLLELAGQREQQIADGELVLADDGGADGAHDVLRSGPGRLARFHFLDHDEL